MESPVQGKIHLYKAKQGKPDKTKKRKEQTQGQGAKASSTRPEKNNGARAKDAHPSIKPRKRGRRKQIAMPDAGKTENRARPSKWPQAL